MLLLYDDWLGFTRHGVRFLRVQLGGEQKRLIGQWIQDGRGLHSLAVAHQVETIEQKQRDLGDVEWHRGQPGILQQEVVERMQDDQKPDRIGAQAQGSEADPIAKSADSLGEHKQWIAARDNVGQVR